MVLLCAITRTLPALIGAASSAAGDLGSGLPGVGLDMGRSNLAGTVPGWSDLHRSGCGKAFNAR